jgi:hypothetical protein
MPPDQFDDTQMAWFEAQLDRDSKSPEIRTVVVGMHEALPERISAGHSMNDSAQGAESGRRSLPPARRPQRVHTTQDVCGYLLATVSADGKIPFEFKQINESDVTESTRKDYTVEFIHRCYAGDTSTYVPAGPTCPAK